MHVTLNEDSQAVWQSQDLERLRYEYSLRPDDLAIDVGAYRGEWATEIHNRYGCKIICIEPGPWIVGVPFQVINKAAATYDGHQTFGGDYYYTSSYEPGSTRYECFDLNSLLEQHKEIALLKMNVEGAEHDLLPHMIRAGMQKRIRNLQIQFHEIENKPYREWYEAITAQLLNTHRLTWRYSFVWENWQRA